MAKKTTRKAAKKKKTTKKKATKKVAKKPVRKKKVIQKKATKAKAVKKKKITKKKTVKKKKITKKKAVKKKKTTKKKVTKKKVAKKAAPKKKTVKKAASKAQSKKPVSKKSKVSADTSRAVAKAQALKEKMAEEVVDLSEEYRLGDILESLKTIDFFASDSDECLEYGCDNLASTGGYCRYHYIKNWKDIKRRQIILQEGRLQKYISELVDKFSDEIVGSVLTDIADEKSFHEVLREMNIDVAEGVFDDLEDDASDSTDIDYETKSIGRSMYDE